MEVGAEVGEGASGRRRYWTAEEKRRIVELTISSSQSVASLARQHGVNANQVFYWGSFIMRASSVGRVPLTRQAFAFSQSRWATKSQRRPRHRRQSGTHTRARIRR
jgi:transposase-like protein